MRGSRVAESLVPQGRDWRPLEPDAGNAAAGSEDQPCDFPRMVFLFMKHPQNGATGVSDMHGKAGRGPESELGSERMISQIFADFYFFESVQSGPRESVEEPAFFSYE